MYPGRSAARSGAKRRGVVRCRPGTPVFPAWTATGVPDQRCTASETQTRALGCALFLKADPVSIEEPPHGGAAARDPLLALGRDDLVQRQVRLLGNESQQPLRMLLQWRGAAAAWLGGDASGRFPPLLPKHHRTRADLIALARLTPRRTGRDGFDHACTQVVGIRLRHRSLHNRINAARLADPQALGNPPDSTRAKYALAQCDVATLRYQFPYIGDRVPS
jgi:hypothetical protein